MEEREKTLDALEKSIQEREKSLDSVSHELKMKEGQLEEQAKEFKLKQIAFASQVKTEKLEREEHFASLEKSIQERGKTLNSLKKSFQESKEHLERQLEEQGRELQSKQKLFDSQQVEREKQHDIFEKSLGERKKQFNVFQKSVQEQKEHLDSLSHRLQMENRQLEKEGKELELKLKQHESQVKADQLALTPTANNMIIPFISDQPSISTDGRSLQLLIAENLNKAELVGGELSALLDADEILKLLGMISQHKQTLQLCQTLGFEDKIPDIIWNLIERKQLIEAVRFICTFKLNDEFPPVPLLIEFVEDAKKCCSEMLSEVKSHDEKEKFVDDRIADLRAVVQCIEDHGLESQYQSIDILMDIQGLQRLKENGKLVLSLPPSVEKQKQRKGRKQSSSTYQLRKRT
ncbi:centromere-associated protein E [Rosa chinensis]|nr:centromere-associated protein E [Rosa chinensis]